MIENKNEQNSGRDVWLKNGNNLSIDSVKDVISFDENRVVLVTAVGELIVDGIGLHISTLDLGMGKVELDGEIEGVFYTNTKRSADEKGGFFSRLFR